MAVKTDLRRQLEQIRSGLSRDERTLKSIEIVKRLRAAADWPAVTSLHYFEPINHLLEVDIRILVDELADKYPDLKLCTSRLIGGSWQLVSAKDTPPPDRFDVIIVPMLGFDPKSLHRIGYGGGYYDRFLAVQPQAKKIGVCYEQGKLDGIPAESYDVSLDLIVTEQLVYGQR